MLNKVVMNLGHTVKYGYENKFFFFPQRPLCVTCR